MATIKSFTSLEQSRKLVEILPYESADMAYYQWKDDGHLMSPIPFVLDGMEEKEDGMFAYIPCWSLAALLDVLPKIHKLKPILDLEECSIQYSGVDLYITASNPVDACYEMITKLKEDNLL